jgi:hypothetical protein
LEGNPSAGFPSNGRFAPCHPSKEHQAMNLSETEKKIVGQTSTSNINMSNTGLARGKPNVLNVEV